MRQSTVAITNASTRFMNGPATATRILSIGRAAGNSAAVLSVLPSIASIGPICGSATYPPNGSHATPYSMPELFQLKIRGPKPMKNRSTTIRRRRAIR